MYTSPKKPMLLTNYSVDRVDVEQEIETQAKLVALASAARLAHYSISRVTSTLSTLYREPNGSTE